MRKRLFEVIELSDGNDKLSRIYDIVMMCAIVISLIPLAFKETNYLFLIVDYVTAGIFVIDYLLRLITADYKLGAAGNSEKPNIFSGGGGKAIFRLSLYAYGYH